ncbi:hypothetical protein D5H75_37445 [Bailinhaonella thermotolerans]|uniref:YtxH domain-containing protein n=1 Tax=Bailinhaonella thermotolerans TaxID=1070861 RepID=A0A3A4APW7_9ACTN|nr:hypothetical protein D5H75_37445 [Bailinhaonella thermotolerans]
MTFLAGAAVGYVLGSKAGRERYEQIKRAAGRLADNPSMQEAAGVLQAQAGRLLGTARERLGGTLGEKFPALRPLNDQDDSPADRSAPPPPH